MFGIGYPELIVVGIVVLLVYIYKRSKNAANKDFSSHKSDGKRELSKKAYYTIFAVAFTVLGIIFKWIIPFLGDMFFAAGGVLILALVLGTILGVDFEMTEKQHIAKIINDISDEVKKNRD